jgi:uncharacterized membrane protein
MQKLLGVVCIVLGIVVGLYIGVWWGLVGGIIQLISGITPTINASNIAWGIAKIFVLAPILGWLSFVVLVVFGKTLLD